MHLFGVNRPAVNGGARRRIANAPFDFASLFTGSDVGFLFDASANSMFQDTGLTVPADTANDVTLRATNQGPGGVVFQAVNSPTYQEVSGLPVLRGSSAAQNRMVAPSAFGTTDLASRGFTLIGLVRAWTLTGDAWALGFGGSAGLGGAYAVLLYNSSGFTLRSRNSASLGSLTSASGGPGNTNFHVAVGRWEPNVGASLRVDGVDITTAAWDSPDSHNVNSASLDCGYINGNTSTVGNMDINLALGIDRPLATEEIAVVEQALAARAGITLP